jgi:threonine dehydrogenase-like Zn-dependent dehydrogenase
MHRVAKHAGVGNIVVEEAPLPAIGPRQVLVCNQRSLISRGSEIGRRYLRPEEIDPAIMGYSSAGVIEQVGAAVHEVAAGQRVTVVAPHAEYVVGDLDSAVVGALTVLPDGLAFDEATFHGLVTGALMWADVPGVRPTDTVVILGQGLVGNLVMQAVRAHHPARIIAVDALDLRCGLARQLGADVVINAATDDPVQAVHALTDGQGADLVIDCVGGQAGLRSFAQAQDMCRPFGTIHLIALYHGEPLPLDASKIQRRRLLGGYYNDTPRAPYAARALTALQTGAIAVAPLLTHHFPYTAAKDAFDLLYAHSDQALGVILTWPEA